MNIRYIISNLGKMILIEALLLLCPLVVAVIYREEIAIWYAAVIALLLLIGGASYLFPQKSDIVRAKEGLCIAGLTWIIFSLFGALPLCLSGDIPNYLDAVFETVSGFTTTGSTILNDVESLSKTGAFWRSFTHWIGGMGVLVFALAILPETDTRSMHIMRAEVPGPTVGKLVSRIRLSARLLYCIYMGMTVILVLFLVAGKMPLFDAIVHAFATAGTGGFSTKALSIAAYNSPYIEIVITVFMLLFSINFNLYYFILIGKLREVWKNEELRWFLGIVATAILAIAANIFSIYQNVGDSLRYSAFQVASIISTCGYATANFDLWPNFSKAILVTLMFIGACAGSTGGGIKITRVMIVVKSAVAQLRKQISPRQTNTVRVEHALLDNGVAEGVSSYLYAYIIVLILSVLGVSLGGFDLTSDFTAVISCLNNIGPGLNVCGPLGSFADYSAFAKVILILDMLLGRLEIFPILALFMPLSWKKN